MSLRLWPLDHGMPENYVPDTHVVKNALGMARDKNPVPELREYGSTYPNLIPYLLLPAYGAQFAIGRVTGAWGGAQEFGQRLMVEPSRAHRTARRILALLSCLAPAIAYRAARAMGLGAGAWGAAYLVATSLLHVHLSTQERPWALMATFLLLACWPAALYAQQGGRRYLLFAGLAAAGAAASHQSGLLVLGVPGLAWLFGPEGFNETSESESMMTLRCDAFLSSERRIRRPRSWSRSQPNAFEPLPVDPSRRSGRSARSSGCGKTNPTCMNAQPSGRKCTTLH